jgi:hypothetical protein
MTYDLTVQQQIESLTYEYTCLRTTPMYAERRAEVRAQLAALGQPLDLLLELDAPQLPTYRHSRSSAHMFTIAWAGPFTRQDFTITENAWGLYFFRGKCKGQRSSRIQYCGITEQYYRDRFRNHHRLYDVTRDLEIWLGRIVSPGRLSRSHLEQAEHMIIHALQLPLNEQCKATEPPPTTIISQWYNRSGQRQANPHDDFPSIMMWDGDVWEKGSLERWP